MKKIILIVSLITAQRGYSQTDSLLTDLSSGEKQWQVSGMLLLTNNAFAPIPAFSFDNPAAMAFIKVGKEHFAYEPDFSIGLNGVPWMWNNWLRYELVRKPSFSFHAGVNPTLFFLKSKYPEDKDLLEAHRNITGELKGTWQKNNKQKFMLTYRYNQAFDSGTISGHFIDFSIEISEFLNFNDFYMNLRPQVFYFDNEGTFDGLFLGNTIHVGHKKSPILLAYQSVQSIWTNFLPQEKYNHNVSLIYLF